MHMAYRYGAYGSRQCVSSDRSHVEADCHVGIGSELTGDMLALGLRLVFSLAVVLGLLLLLGLMVLLMYNDIVRIIRR